ncbi:MAG: c-type cytochrome [gamma proteobacterium symbiont of Bathyaustriella thionipta]|nr:c-type cytochrome [gamma proteobacterium symbiont of Bathyaustriella thionipta]
MPIKFNAAIFVLAFSLILASPVLQAQNPDGQVLYQKHCSACHQTEGHGGIGLPLSQDKISRISDGYINRSIKFGRPGRLMPPFQHELSTAEIQAIVSYLRSWTDQPSPEDNLTAVKGNAEAGKTLYTKYCVRCHDSDGSGVGRGTGVTLSRERRYAIMPAAINNPGFHASVTDQMIRDTIAHGRAGSIMPSFSQKGLNDEEINNLVAYVRTLASTENTSESDIEEPAVYRIESPYDFETTVENVRQTVAGNNFRVFPDRYLEQGLSDRAIGLKFIH